MKYLLPLILLAPAMAQAEKYNCTVSSTTLEEIATKSVTMDGDTTVAVMSVDANTHIYLSKFRGDLNLTVQTVNKNTSALGNSTEIGVMVHEGTDVLEANCVKAPEAKAKKSRRRSRR
jgi:hypothetical protein